MARSGAPTLVPKMLKGGVLYVFYVCEFITMWGFMVGNGVKCFGIYDWKPKENICASVCWLCVKKRKACVPSRSRSGAICFRGCPLHYAESIHHIQINTEHALGDLVGIMKVAARLHARSGSITNERGGGEPLTTTRYFRLRSSASEKKGFCVRWILYGCGYAPTQFWCHAGAIPACLLVYRR